MATPGQRDAYRRVVNLILEEVVGCELNPQSPETVELMNVVRELEQRIIEGPDLQKMFTFTKPGKPHHKPHPFKREYQPKAKKPRAWQQGPLATVSAGPVSKPPWFTET